MTDTPHSPSNPIKPHSSQTGKEELELRSEYFYESRCQGTMSTSEVLDSIEEQIGEIELKLKKIKEEKTSLSPGSQECIDLQDRRRLLKKQLIDLDYQHNLYCDKLKSEQLQTKPLPKEQYKNERQDTQTEVKESSTPQRTSNYQSFYLEYERKVQEELDKMQKESRVRIEQLEKEMKSEEKEIKQQKGSNEQNQKNVRKTEEQLEKELIQAQYRSRMAELELEMASQTLRRSREVELEAELSSLKLSNPPIVPPYDVLGSYYLPNYSDLVLERYLGLYPDFELL